MGIKWGKVGKSLRKSGEKRRLEWLKSFLKSGAKWGKVGQGGEKLLKVMKSGLKTPHKK